MTNEQDDTLDLTEKKPRSELRVGTLVWGLIVIALGICLGLIAYDGINFDPIVGVITLFSLIGVGLIVAAVASGGSQEN